MVTAIGAGKSRQFNARFLSMMNHYLIEPVACILRQDGKGPGRKSGIFHPPVAVYAKTSIQGSER